MKKAILKTVVFLLTFVAALVLISGIMNQGNQNMTAEMAGATLPVISMEKDGILYNELHGYVSPMETAYQRETITELGEDRELSFVIDTYGTALKSIDMEVRSTDGSRLIENGPVRDITVGEGQVRAGIALKDLIERDKEYALVILLDIGREEPVRYYTRVVWSSRTKALEKLQFVQYFHDTLYSKELARQENIAVYLESNASGDNTTFHKVNIHSSFQQITWGDLEVREVLAPKIRVTDLARQTGSLVLDFMVSTGSGKDTVYYMVEEYFRVRLIEGAARMYLLDYERTMTQIPDVKKGICANDKILLGIGDENMPIVENEDGNVVVFQAAGRLCSYNANTKRIAVLFSFYDEENADARALYPQHNMKVWNVDEGGNVNFAVYGYMNRGTHEGEVGILICSYDSTMNMVEEVLFIPYTKSESLLEREMEQLMYLNWDGQLYFTLDQTVYCVSLGERSVRKLVTVAQDGGLRVSDDHRTIVWQQGSDIYHSDSLAILDLTAGRKQEVSAPEGDTVMPLGFIGEDIIYGLAHLEDVTVDLGGKVFFPMYQVNICNLEGKILKESGSPGMYFTDCSVLENQITLGRVSREEDGTYREVDAEHIMSNAVAESSKNQLVVAAVDVFEKYVQIQTRGEIDVQNLQVLIPREVVYEGSRSLSLEKEGALDRYYVYTAYGVSDICLTPAAAVNAAYAKNGVVTDESGTPIWIRSNRVTKNQIMAIKADAVSEERSSLAVCLDTILSYEEVDRNCQSLLDQGKTAAEILRDNLEETRILDLSGCSLDAVLYYVNRDIPVLAILEDGEAVLITGFNQYNIVLMEPSSGRLYQKGLNDSARWFEENGNCFLTYVRPE